MSRRAARPGLIAGLRARIVAIVVVVACLTAGITGIAAWFAAKLRRGRRRLARQRHMGPERAMRVGLEAGLAQPLDQSGLQRLESPEITVPAQFCASSLGQGS